MGSFSYFHQFCESIPGAIKRVNIFDEIAEVRRFKSDPGILINLNALTGTFRRFLQKEASVEMLFGGCWASFTADLSSFFSTLKSSGVRLEFVFNCKIDPSTYHSSSRFLSLKLDDAYIKRSKILGSFNRSGNWKFMYNCKEIEDVIPMELFLALVIHTAEKFGEVHGHYYKENGPKSSLFHADLAQKSRCFAIMGYSAHYFMAPGGFRYWCIKDLNFSEFKIREYNRIKILQNLGITMQQLTFVAALSFESNPRDPRNLQRIRQHFKYDNSNTDVLFKNLVNFVKRLESPINLKAIVKHTTNQENPELASEIKDCLESFNPFRAKEQKKPESFKLLEGVYSRGNCFAYKILKSYVISIQSPNLEYKLAKKKKYYDLVIPLLKKTMGILLEGKFRNKGDVGTIPVQIKRDAKTCTKIHEIEPIIPNFEIPPLGRIIYGHLPDSYEHTILQWLLTWRLEESILREIPESFKCEILVLYYLKKMDFISSFDGIMILETLVEQKNNKIPEGLQCPQIIYDRDFRICQLFLMFQQFFNCCLSSIGLHNLVSDLALDAVYFQIKCTKLGKLFVKLNKTTMEKFVKRLLKIADGECSENFV